MIFSTELLNDYIRPVIKVDGIYRNCHALIDSGAVVPVWTKSSELLRRLGATKLKGSFELHGFGGDGENCEAYRLTVILGNIMYPNLTFVVSSKVKGKISMVLPATMFNKFDCNIDFINSRFTIRNLSNQMVYNYVITDSNGKTYNLSQEVYEISKSNNDDFRLDPIPETGASSIHFDDKPIGTLGSLK